MIEIIIFLIKTKNSTRMNFLKEIEPLPLDPALDSEYLQFILKKRTSNSSSIIDEVEDCHLNIKDLKNRIAIIDMIRNNEIFI
jgi:hypothetical protein